MPDTGDGPALYATGDFTLARWQGCPDVEPPVVSCPASILENDPLQGAPGEIVSFAVTAEDDRDPSPTIVCTPPSGSFFPRGTTLVTCTATDAAGNQASCQFPVTVQIKARRE